MSRDIKKYPPAAGLTNSARFGGPGAKNPDYVKAQVNVKAKSIITTHAADILLAANTLLVPRELVSCFIHVESDGKADAGFSASSDTPGLMQWNVKFVYARIEKARQEKRLPAVLSALLEKKGYSFSGNEMSPRTVRKKDAIDPTFNIWIGTLILRDLLDSNINGKFESPAWAVEGGKIRLDRIISVYNAGAYSVAGEAARKRKWSTMLETANNVNDVTSTYVKSIGGEGALIDSHSIIWTDLKY